LKIFCYTSGHDTNFGDDLNRWLWNRLLHRSLDADDGTLLLGIGTVISRNLIPPSKRYIVLSSGVGYSPAPVGFGGPDWKILSVRGPLTAAALGLPPQKAIVDGAALLRLLPECAPLPLSQRSGVAFMPHFASLSTGNWKAACEQAGFDFLDPFAGSEETVQRIRRARIVIADAMHAAIVADALRVPWIPVALSPQSNTFKWLDWTLSLGLPYNPARLHASSLLESIRCRSFTFYGERHFLENRMPSYALEHYKRAVRLKSLRNWSTIRWRMEQLTYELPKRIVSSSVLSAFKQRQDLRRTEYAAEELHQVAKFPLYLSEERLFMSKLDQLADMLPKLEDAFRIHPRQKLAESDSMDSSEKANRPAFTAARAALAMPPGSPNHLADEENAPPNLIANDGKPNRQPFSVTRTA
jgi:succinoglycan biosynthesis protein ExoV